MERKSPPFHFLIVKAELAYTIITATAKIARQQPMIQYVSQPEEPCFCLNPGEPTPSRGSNMY